MSEMNLSFENAIAELEEIVQKLEKGELSLEESISFFQRGVELAKYCSNKLDEAERSITMLIEDDKRQITEVELPEYGKSEKV